jgi:hypothetical protein
MAWRFSVIAVHLLCVAQLLYGGAVTPEAREVEKILALSTAAPPELAADIRLQLVERRAQLLHESFDLAPSATFKLPQISSGAGASQSTDTDAGMLNSAAGLNADTLSLQLRAVEQLLLIHPQTALSLFDSITGPQIPVLSCSNAMGYSLKRYYETVDAIYKGAFNPADRH